MPGRNVSTWRYAEQIGDILFSLLGRYKTYYIALSRLDTGIPSIKAAHLFYMRSCFTTLQSLYNLVRPMITGKDREELDKEMDATRTDIEDYLRKLNDGYASADYSLVIKLDNLERKLLDKMQLAGVLYSSEKFVSESKILKERYGVDGPRKDSLFPGQ